ncbi:MAG: outer membrane lipoprotein carrier protein LolA [Bacteroidales bacterium]|jgi:outer membrane lipoprotein-sorting protein|nr:outer membrane lipoprotein carrier protein LolA [Bacteroidales bacterium]
MKNVITLIICAFASLTMLAQGQVPQMETLDQVAAKTEKYIGLKIDFTMYVENLHNAKRDSYKGSAIYKSGLYKMDIMGQVVYSDGKTNWTYLKDAEEINITNNSENEAFMTNPQAILKDYKSKFKVNYISDKFEKNRALMEFDFFPKQIDNKKYSKITIRIDKTKKQIFSVRYVGKDGVNYLVEIDKMLENPTIQDSEVKFNKTLYPDAEIIDMR